MQKIKKGLEEKLYLISKIQNNLKIKKVQIKKPSEKINLQFPNIQKQNHQEKENLSQAINNPQNQKNSWMNIKKISNQESETNFMKPNYSYRKYDTSKQQMVNSYTSRFITRNSPVKLVQFRTIGDVRRDKNYSTQILRKTYLQRTSRIFSPEKKDKLKLFKAMYPQKDYTFYGKINQTNHILGTKFKTLDPRFGGLTREQLKQKIKSRSIVDDQMPTLNRFPLSTSLNMYEIESFLKDEGRYASFQRYNFISDNKRNERNERKKRKGSTKQKYSPWNQESQELANWDQLPKIK